MYETAGSLIDSAAILTPDNKQVLVCSGKVVKFYDAQSGELVRRVRSEYELSGLVLDPAHEERILCSSKTGEILGVCLESGEKSVLGKVDRGLGRIISAGSLIFALSSDKQKIYQIQSSKEQRLKVFPVSKGKSIGAVAASPEHLAYASGKRLYLWSVSGDAGRKAVDTAELPHLITAMAWSGPSDLVLGFTNGSMLVIRSLVQGLKLTEAIEKHSQKMHWHSNTVLAMAGCLLDGYLVSGGHEGVAVQWSLGRGASGLRSQYLPRLGAAIRWASVSPDGTKWLLSLADNTLCVIASETFSVTRSIRGLQPPILPAKSIHQSPLDPCQVIMPGSTGMVQVFDVVYDKHVALLHVTRENIVSSLPEDHDSGVQHRHVTLTAVHASGLMATYEELKGEDGSSKDKSTLRIWRLNAEKAAYVQEAVHDESGLTALCFKPTFDGSAELVCGCSDGHARLWRFKQSNLHWEATAKHHVAHAPILSADCSSDGSLLAMTSGPSVLLLDAQTLQQCHVLTYSTDVLQEAKFIESSDGDWLAAWDAGQVSVWDLGTLKLQWSLRMLVLAMAVRKGKLAIAAKSPASGSSYTFMFKPDSPTPIMARRHSAPFHALAFLQAKRRDAKQKSKPVLFGLSALSFHQAFPEEEPVDDPLISAALPARSALAQAASQASDRLIPVAGANDFKPKLAARDLLLQEVPSHVLPSMRLLCASFFKLRLAPPQ